MAYTIAFSMRNFFIDMVCCYVLVGCCNDTEVVSECWRCCRNVALDGSRRISDPGATLRTQIQCIAVLSTTTPLRSSAQLQTDVLRQIGC